MSTSRRHRLLGAALAGSLLLAGCTGSADPQGSPSPAPATSPGQPASSAPGGPVTLRFQVYGGPAELASYRRLADVYQERHGEVTVEVRALASEARAAGLLEEQFGAGSAPDVFLLGRDRLAGFVAEQRLTPVDQLLEARGVLFGDNYQRLGLEAFSADSALQCMPHDVSPLVLYYNTRLVQLPEALEDVDPEADPDADPDADPEAEPEVPALEEGWTWEQFTAVARAAAGPGVDGFFLDPSLDTLTALVRSAGEGVADEERDPTTLTLSEEGPRTAVRTVLDTVHAPRLHPTARELARMDGLTRFTEGRVAMLVGTRALVPELRAVPGLAFDVFPLPHLGRYRTTVRLSGYCIASSTPDVEAAADFLAFASSPEGAGITAASGAVVPENLSVLHSPAFTQGERQPAHPEVFADAVRRAEPMPYAVGWPEVEALAEPLLARLFEDPDAPVDRLLARLDRRSVRVLGPPDAD